MDYFLCGGETSNLWKGLGNRIYSGLTSNIASDFAGEVGKQVFGRFASVAGGVSDLGSGNIVSGLGGILRGALLGDPGTMEKAGQVSAGLYDSIVDTGRVVGDYFGGGIDSQTMIRSGLTELKKGQRGVSHNFSDRLKGSGCLGRAGENMVDFASFALGGDENISNLLAELGRNAIKGGLNMATQGIGNVASWLASKLGLKKKSVAEGFECNDCANICRESKVNTAEFRNMCLKCKANNCPLLVKKVYSNENDGKALKKGQRVVEVNASRKLQLPGNNQAMLALPAKEDEDKYAGLAPMFSGDYLDVDEGVKTVGRKRRRNRRARKRKNK